MMTMSSKKEMRAEIVRNQHALKEQLADLYVKLKDDTLTVGQRERLDQAIRSIKRNLEPKTRAVCKHFGLPTDSELIRRGVVPALLAFVMGSLLGCVTKSTHTECDRQVNSQTRGAAEVAEKSIGKIRSEFQEGSDGWTMLGLGLSAIADIKANADQQEKIHGAPETTAAYSPDAARKARERSTKEHESGGLGGTLLAVGGVAVGVAGALAGMPWLSRMFPQLTGAIGKAAEVGRRIVAFARERFEEKGMPDAAKELLKVASEENADYGIQDFQKKKADALEEKLGLDLKVKLADPAPAPMPTPTPTPVDELKS
jgi:hypothetical protein